MSLPTASTLKSYFETGARPTAAQFAELIDTVFALYQDAVHHADEVAGLSALHPHCKLATLVVHAGEDHLGCTVSAQFPSADLSLAWVRQESGQEVFRLTFAQPLWAGDQALVNVSGQVAWTALAPDGSTLDFGLADTTPEGAIIHFAII